MSEITFLGPDSMSEPITYVGLYSDGTPMVKTAGWTRIVDRAHTMVLRPKSLMSFVDAMFLVDAITLAGGRIHKLVLPYVPGARQDRSNPTGDVLFTAQSVADMINARRFSRVVILDPHSPVTPNIIHNVRVFPSARVTTKLPTGYDGVIAPDDGGRKRAEDAAFVLGVPVFYGGKHRDVSTGKLTGFSVEPLKEGGHYLVVDDICDGGGTFIGLGEKIREQGATADLFVSHGIFAKGTSDMRKIYQNIYTTDSRDIHDTHVQIIEVVKEMENYS